MRQLKKDGNVKVYLHLRNDTNEIFYIGIGIKNRPYDSGRNPYWNNIVNKYGYTVKIVAENLSWKVACKLEIHLIKKYGRKDLGLGKLVNMTNGGDGSIGAKWSKESRIKLSKLNLGRTLSKETKEKLRIANTGKIRSEQTKLNISKAHIGNINSPETRAKISKSNTGKICREETKIKISSSNFGKTRTEEFKENYRGNNNPNFGKKMSQEAKEKAKETWRLKRELKEAS